VARILGGGKRIPTANIRLFGRAEKIQFGKGQLRITEKKFPKEGEK